eukprot:2030203-Rhodomonas_salina.4
MLYSRLPHIACLSTLLCSALSDMLDPCLIQAAMASLRLGPHLPPLKGAFDVLWSGARPPNARAVWFDVGRDAGGRLAGDG